MTKSRMHDYLMTLLIVVCIVVATVIGGWSIPSTAYAESGEDIQSRYEQTNVMSNLKGSSRRAAYLILYLHGRTSKCIEDFT